MSLILSRKCNESIMLGDHIEVFVYEIGEVSVKLGISAPKDLPVHRREVYDAIQREREASK